MLCFGSHIISFVWRQAIICLVLKDSNSDQRVPLNFWVISLLSTIYEMYRSIFNNRLILYLKDNDLLIDEQNGYRRERSCACYVFNSTVLYRIEKKHDFVTWPIKKLFDRDLLKFLILHNGIDGDFYNLIKSIYGNTVSCVRVRNLCTDFFSTTAGVRQRDNLSPTLFDFFLSTISQEIKKRIKIHNVLRWVTSF